MKKSHKCGLCGEKKPVYREINLPHSPTIYLCWDCRDLAMFKIHNGFPIAWLSPEDLYEEGLTDHITKEELEGMSDDEFLKIARGISDYLWDGGFGDQFHELIKLMVNDWRKSKEEELIKNTPKEDLPLLIDNIKYPENKTLYEKRLKED